ncbi:hypothetical protein B0T26DRAFT_751862 [Lasiosphaeria miniovina]|uniref:Uncharacterized protein n=1 Tax=Lasiosphaeria miniovina TaxID=1954250 RepID=A0AA40AL57_9PEZI|nr:uncharacterized protein B0T26DRAFT_751862 [Lasiosphaeria miniovina]KAK0717857.1 hypothetical protein B0T26DRAFT_751862 [Lasiosphaeria miniovina]
MYNPRGAPDHPLVRPEILSYLLRSGHLYLLDIGDFASTKSPNRDVLLSETPSENAGLGMLINICMELNAHKCREFLIEEWAPANGFTYDKAWEYDPTRDPAQHHPDLDYYLALLAQCRAPGSDPSLIAYLAQKLGPPDTPLGISSTDKLSGRSQSPLSEAARSLNVGAMHVLIKHGADYNEEGIVTASHNPLYAVLGEELPWRPPPHSRSGTGAGVVIGPETRETVIETWRSNAKRTASLISSAVGLLMDERLFDANFKAFKRSKGYQDMLNTATVVYVDALRSFLLKSLKWQLAMRGQIGLLRRRARRVASSRSVHATTTTTNAGDDDSSQDPDGDNYYRNLDWHREVDGPRLQEALAAHGLQLENDFVTAWEQLATPDMLEETHRSVGPGRRSKPLSLRDSLYEFIASRAVGRRWRLMLHEAGMGHLFDNDTSDELDERQTGVSMAVSRSLY